MLKRILSRRQEHRRLRREIGEELAFHVDQLEAENVALGMEPSSARRDALLRFGDPGKISKDCARIALEPDDAAEEMAHHDLRVSVPAMAAGTALLMLGIVLLFLPHHLGKLPYRDPQRLLLSSRPLPPRAVRNLAEHAESLWKPVRPSVSRNPSRLDRARDVARVSALDDRRDPPVLEQTAAFRRVSMALSGPEVAPVTLKGLVVSSSFFNVLGVSRELGSFDPPLEPDSLVLSYDLWQGGFSGESGVIGRQVSFDDRTYTVAGVAPANFWFLHPGDQFWITQAEDARRSQGAMLVARLGPTATPRSARNELADILGYSAPRTAIVLTPLARVSNRWLRAGAWLVAGFLLLLGLLGLLQSFTLSRSLAGVRAQPLALLRNYGFLALKAAPLLVILALTWVSLNEWDVLAPAGYFSAVLSFVATYGLMLACVAVVWWSLIDQRLRCYLCLRRVRMPINLGTFGSILFDMPGTEYICAHGHGTLYVPAPTSEGLQEPRWRAPSGFWEDLLHAPTSQGL